MDARPRRLRARLAASRYHAGAIARAGSVGAGMAVVAWLVRGAITGLVGPEVPFITFYPAVALAAWAAGLAGGVGAAATATIIVGLEALTGGGPTPGRPGLVALIVFAPASLLIAGLGGSLRRSRDEAERARRRQAFLARASAIIHADTEQAVGLQALVDVAVPEAADWCAVDLFDDAGRFRRAWIAAPDAALAALGHELRRRNPPRPDAQSGIAAVARTGDPEVMVDVPADLPDGVDDQETSRMLEDLGIRSWLAMPMILPDGRVLGVLSMAMSVSGRRFAPPDVENAAELARRAAVAMEHATLFAELQERRDELHAVLQAVADAVIVANGAGMVTSLNAAAASLPGGIAAVGRPLARVLAEIPSVDPRRGLRQAPGDRRYLLPVVHEIEVRGRTRRVAILQDRTEVVESEAARDTFVSMLSHELRTPITTIYGSAQVLRRPLPDSTRAGLVEDLAAEAERLYRLVEDLLVLSRFERGRLDVALEPVLVQRVIAGAMARAAREHPGLDVRVETPMDLPPVIADATYVEQIVRNLVSNAVKYAGPAATIAVRFQHLPDRVEIQVEDDGPGIPPEAAERVFGLYERLPGAGLMPGAGIGLFVCRRLARAMGGEMTVSHGSLGGARFTVTLPLATDAEPGAARRIEEPSTRPA